MIEQYTSPVAVNNSQEPWLVGEGVVVSGGVAIPSLDFNFITGGLPGTVTFTRASTATYFNSAGVLTSAAINEARFDYDPVTLAARGLLIEEARTNGIRNNTMQGAVAGTPGTAPTNWQQSAGAGGITVSVVGTGVENGVTYVDLKWSGTPTSTNFPTAFFDTTTGIAALQNQTWTVSSYIKLVGGSLANVSNIQLGMWETNAAGGFLAAGTGTSITPTNANLATQRSAFTRTLTNASTAFVRPLITFTATSGLAIDITLRIGLPQLEQGAFATSVIPTTTTALTRNADVASVNTLSPWYNSAAGTLFAEGTVVNSISGTTPREYAEFGNAAGTDRIAVEARSATSTRARTVTGGVSVISSDTYDALGKNVKITGAYGSDGITVCVDGRAPITTASAIPTPDTLYLGVNYAASASSVINGYLRRITYYPRRLSNAELQAITA